MTPSRLPSLLPLPSLLALALVGCGEPPPPRTAPVVARPTSRAPRPRAPVASTLTGGSSDGPTCEQAIDQNNDELGMGKKGQADLTSDEIAAVLNQGGYLNECEVPSDAEVSVCAAIKEGRAVGVTVALRPSNPDAERCVAGRVRALGYPSHPKLDVARTTFK
jgi:hypothetical protein